MLFVESYVYECFTICVPLELLCVMDVTALFALYS